MNFVFLRSPFSITFFNLSFCVPISFMVRVSIRGKGDLGVAFIKMLSKGGAKGNKGIVRGKRAGLKREKGRKNVAEESKGA